MPPQSQAMKRKEKNPFKLSKINTQTDVWAALVAQATAAKVATLTDILQVVVQSF